MDNEFKELEQAINKINNKLESLREDDNLTISKVEAFEQELFKINNELSSDNKILDEDIMEYIQEANKIYRDKKDGLREDMFDTSNITVGESERHITSRRVGQVVSIVLIAGIIVGTAFTIKSCSKNTKFVKNDKKIEKEKETKDINETKENNNNINYVVDPTLNFDAENTESMISNINESFKDLLPKGFKLDSEYLSEDIKSFINYYVWMNLGEMGPTYLSELYQTDSISYMRIFEDSIKWATEIRMKSITSSKKDNTVIDSTNFISNKKDADLVQSFLNINGELHDAVNANNKEEIEKIVSEYKKLIETKLLDHSSYTYGGGALDLAFRLVYTGEQLLSNYDYVIMDEGLSHIINEDEFLMCYYKIAYSTMNIDEMKKENYEEIISEYRFDNTSKKSDNVIYIVDELKEKLGKLNMSLDFTNKKSYKNVITEVLKNINDNKLLDTYKESISIEKFFMNNYDLVNKSITIDNNLENYEKTYTSDNEEIYVAKEEIQEHNASSISEYIENVKKETESIVSNETNFTDSTGEVKETGSNTYDYAKEYKNGYVAGSKQGAIDGSLGYEKNTNVSGTNAYKEGYVLGYNSSYNDALAVRNSAKESTTKTYTEVTPSIISEEVIEEGINKVETTTKAVETTTKAVETTTKAVETTKPAIGTVVEEEIIEEGILTSKNDLYNMYYDAIYGHNTSVDSPKTYTLS